jgi:hypothetical protein
VPWDGASSPRPQSPSEKARALAARAEADAEIALARFESLSRTRDDHRRRAGRAPLGADPSTVAPAGWAGDRASMLVIAGSTAQPMTPAQAVQERRRLLWLAAAKIVGALVAVGIGVAIGSAMIAGMAG